MRKIIALFICLLLIFSTAINVSAVSTDSAFKQQLILLRAGSGGGSGSSGSGSGSSGSGNSSDADIGVLPHHSAATSEQSSPLDSVFLIIIFAVIFFFSSILFYFRMTKYSRKSKKLMKQLMKSDSSWKYNEIISSVSESYFAIQNAWAESDMSSAAQYMTESMYNSLQIKLNWMTYRNEKNIMKDIRLIHALPVSVYDDKDDSKDCIWFYIKGRMIDYTISTKTQAVISGLPFPSAFEEFWQFTRKGDSWVLNTILQKNEADKISFIQ